MFDETLNERESRIDKLQLLGVFGLMLLGTAFVYSATMANEPTGAWQQFKDVPFREFLVWMISQYFFKQILWYAIGIGAGIAVCLIDYHTLARWSFVIYGATIILLVLVLLTPARSGARRWFDLGFFSLQPSEFAKLAFILALANFCSRPPDEMRRLATFAKALGLMALPFLLIVKEPDLGSSLVLLPTGFVMLYVAGVPRKFLVTLLGGVGIVAVLFVADILFAPPGWQMNLESYQERRLLVYFGRDYTSFAPPNASPAELQRLREQQERDTYNIREALISVGSGGLFGRGWLQGTQHIYGYLPSAGAHNDFIFSVIAEEEGFVGSLLVLTLYSVILFTGIRIAGQARDRLGKMMAVGVVTLLFSHVFINIGMNIRIVPVTGIPLPLLSYGGSSVLGSLIALAMLQNVNIHRRNY